MEGKVAEKAAELSATKEGNVPVVCTPTGGSQSVRLNIDENWNEQLSEEQLLDAILKEKGQKGMMKYYDGHYNLTSPKPLKNVKEKPFQIFF